MTAKLAGALLVLAAAAVMGLSGRREMQGRIRQCRRVLARLEHMRTEVCQHAAPLPELIGAWAAEERALFSFWRAEEMPPGEAFSETWERLVAGMDMAPAGREALLAWGRELMGGGDAERAFAVAVSRWEELLTAATQEWAEKGRLVPALSLCAGVLVVVVLL